MATIQFYDNAGQIEYTIHNVCSPWSRQSAWQTAASGEKTLCWETMPTPDKHRHVEAKLVQGNNQPSDGRF